MAVERQWSDLGTHELEPRPPLHATITPSAKAHATYRLLGPLGLQGPERVQRERVQLSTERDRLAPGVQNDPAPKALPHLRRERAKTPDVAFRQRVPRLDLDAHQVPGISAAVLLSGLGMLVSAYRPSGPEAWTALALTALVDAVGALAGYVARA